MSNLSFEDKIDQSKDLKNNNYNQIDSLVKNKFISKRKTNNIYNKINKRILSTNKDKLLFEDQEENKENELIIKSNNFISRKRDYIIHSSKRLKKYNKETKNINYETDHEFIFNNIFDFRPETERNQRDINKEKGFMRKIDYDLNNLINKKNKNERAKTAKINYKRGVDKSINVMENNLNKFIETQTQNSFLNNNYLNNVNDNFYNNDYFNQNNYISINTNNDIFIPNEEEEKNIKKKKINKENIININGDIDHKILFLDNRNNLISKSKTINLLKEEEKLIAEKIKNDYRIKKFSYFIKNKNGKKIILPILYENIIKRNNNDNDNDDINIINKENNDPFMTSVIKQNKKINNLYYLLDIKPKSSKLNNININNINNNINNNDDNIITINNKNLSSIKNINTINNIKNINNNHKVFITSYSNKKKLTLNHDKFNKYVVINKKQNSKKRNNSNVNKNKYFNFNSKYPYTDTNGIEIIDKLDNKGIAQPASERKKYFKDLFKKKFKSNYTKGIIDNNNDNKIKTYKVLKTEPNIIENKISFSIDKNKIIKKKSKKIKKVEKEEKIRGKEKKPTIKKNKEEIKTKEKININRINNRKKSTFKYKNKDLLRINTNYKDLLQEKEKNNENIEGSSKNKYDFNYDFDLNLSNNSADKSKNSEISDENKEQKGPKKLGLLINHIKNVLNNEKKKQENKIRERDLKESYDFFREQLEKVDKVKITKLKRLYSEMHSANKDENSDKKNFLHSLTKNYNKYENILNKNSENEDIIKEENENKNIQNEKNKLLVEEMNLINEIKFYMSTMDDPESQRKFENLLKQIENYRKLNDKEYIESIKQTFGSFKEEIEDIFRTKEIEDRINGFITNLDKDVNRVEIKRSFYESLLNIVDHRFKIIFSKFNI